MTVPYSPALVFKRRHRLQLEQIPLVHAVDLRLRFRILAYAFSDISVEYSVCKAQVVFVRQSAEPVDSTLSTNMSGSPAALPIAFTSCTVKCESGLKSPAPSPYLVLYPTQSSERLHVRNLPSAAYDTVVGATIRILGYGGSPSPVLSSKLSNASSALPPCLHTILYIYHDTLDAEMLDELV